METTARGERIAVALEQEFQLCHQMLENALDRIRRQGSFEDWEMRGLVGLMRTTAQLAGTINRIEQKQSAKNSENRSSSPQENCA